MQPERPIEPRREMITWEEVNRLIDHLIPQFRREFTAMVMITRGGIVPGGMLAEAMDITLRPASKAVDAGVVLPGINDGFTGKAPDLGCYEAGKPIPHYGPRRPAK